MPEPIDTALQKAPVALNYASLLGGLTSVFAWLAQYASAITALLGLVAVILGIAGNIWMQRKTRTEIRNANELHAKQMRVLELEELRLTAGKGAVK